MINKIVVLACFASLFNACGKKSSHNADTVTTSVKSVKSGSFYVCKSSESPNIRFVIDFENLNITTVSSVRMKSLASEDMISADSSFSNVGDSLAKERKGELENGGQVSIEKSSGYRGSYRGDLTFGEKWIFEECLLGQD